MFRDQTFTYDQKYLKFIKKETGSTGLVDLLRDNLQRWNLFIIPDTRFINIAYIQYYCNSSLKLA